jgi:Na+/proline symporter
MNFDELLIYAATFLLGYFMIGLIWPFFWNLLGPTVFYQPVEADETNSMSIGMLWLPMLCIMLVVGLFMGTKTIANRSAKWGLSVNEKLSATSNRYLGK